MRDWSLRRHRLPRFRLNLTITSNPAIKSAAAISLSPLLPSSRTTATLGWVEPAKINSTCRQCRIPPKKMGRLVPIPHTGSSHKRELFIGVKGQMILGSFSSEESRLLLRHIAGIGLQTLQLEACLLPHGPQCSHLIPKHFFPIHTNSDLEKK